MFSGCGNLDSLEKFFYCFFPNQILCRVLYNPLCSIASKSLLCPTKFIIHIEYCTIHLTFTVYLLQHRNCFLCNAFCIMDLRHRIFLIASYILHFTHYLSAYTMLITYCILHILTYILHVTHLF